MHHLLGICFIIVNDLRKRKTTCIFHLFIQRENANGNFQLWPECGEAGTLNPCPGCKLAQSFQRVTWCCVSRTKSYSFPLIK